MIEELRELNFSKLINLDFPHIESYTFSDYRYNHYEHYPIKSYCISCEKKNWHRSVDDRSFQLSYLSHGAHSADFIESLNPPLESLNDWHDEAVMFIYDIPTDNKIYTEVNYLNYSKRPAKKWCWIEGEANSLNQFQATAASHFMLSTILTFRLANAYVTHLVKCGMSNPEQQVKPINFYQEDCIRNCFREFLAYEINILKPRVIFAVGTLVEQKLFDLVGNSYLIQSLPHPKTLQGSLSDEEFQILYFWLILRALFKTSVISLEEAKELTETFLHQFTPL